MQPTDTPNLEGGREAGSDDILKDHQWIAAWKKPETRTSSPQRSLSGGKLRPAYDSALESYGGGTGKAGAGKATRLSTEASTTQQVPADAAQPSTNAPARLSPAERTASGRLLAMDFDEPEAGEGSALRYGHQDTIMSPLQYRALQRRYMGGQPPADTFDRNDGSYFTAAFILAWVWFVYPGSFIRSLASVLAHAAQSAIYVAWCKLRGKSQSSYAAAPPAYEVIPTSRYLQVALARRAAAARNANLISISE